MDDPMDNAALEKGVYSTFHQNVVTWRPAGFNKLVTLDKLTLPNNSVLHTVDQFLEIKPDTVLPDLNNPLIKNETWQLYLETVLSIPSANAVFPITDTYRFRPVQFTQQIRDFWSKHHAIKRPASRDAMIHRSQTLPLFNYNAILTAQIQGGKFQYYRHFDLLFRTILNTMLPITGKNQWLQIPLSRTVYRKVQFAQTFDAITYQTVRIKDDPSFFFLIHMINFVSKTASTSLFSQLPENTLDTFNIVMTAGNQAIIYNLGDLKALLDKRSDNNFYQVVLRHINTLKLAGYADHDISGLDDADYDKLVDDVAPDDSHAPAESEDEPPSPAPASLPKPTPHPAKKPAEHQTDSDVKKTEPPHESRPENPEKVIPPPTDVHPQKSLEPHPADNDEPVSPPKTIPQLPLSPTSLITTIDHGAQASILAATHLTDEQRTAAIKASQVYKTLKIDGVTIEDHLRQLAEPDLTVNHLDFLKDKVVDQSMLSSSAIDLDKHYLEHVMARDLASVVASLNTHGMFLVHAEQRDDVTQLNRIRFYKIAYQDLNGRRHSLAFKFPIVSSDGTITTNGIESRMIKQQVNLPICKIDDNRVSLASSYNKTLVERINTKAHNFAAYITRYIAAVYKAKVGLELNYGSLTTDVKLPYDYTSLARHYSMLKFKSKQFAGWQSDALYRFVFSYENRFTEHDIAVGVDKMVQLESKYGVFCGTASTENIDFLLFFGYDNKISFVYKPDATIRLRMQLHPQSIMSILFSAFEDKVPAPKTLSEWTELKILDKNFPIVFILGFEYGLQRVLDHMQIVHQFIPYGQRFPRQATTIVVPFADGNLVFDRYPLEKSFILAGLLKFTTKPYEFAQFNTQDIYYSLLRDSGLSLNYLKGISDFFKLFIDPITRDVLLRMHEPTDVGRLLVRATEMLATEYAIPSASMANHRIRGYERFSTTLYNEMARAYASYTRMRGNRKAYSINPESVFQRLIQDQTLHIIEEINPVENVKDKHAATYTGGGGRTAQSFVIADRQFPKDGVGVLSEATPYNSKVAINTYLTVDPLIANIRGMFDLKDVDVTKLQPSQILSVAALLMPCTTNDDRNGF